MTEEEDIRKDLKIRDEDVSHAILKSTLSYTPFIGGPLAEFFSLVIAPPLEQRRDAWTIEIYTRLKKLEDQIEGFKVESLAQNEVFISTLFYATQAAMRTHQKEKLQALRNAVINTAKMSSPEENSQLMFLNLVDRYTPMHLTLLQLLDYPEQFGKRPGITIADKKHRNSITQLIDHTFPNFSKDPVVPQILKDLTSDGLLTPDMENKDHRPIVRVSFTATTKLGKQFLKFISDES